MGAISIVVSTVFAQGISTIIIINNMPPIQSFLSYLKDFVVGVIALLEPDKVVPCDGIFISGHKLKCDESGATGESALLRRFLSGSKVLEGVSKYVIVAVGSQ